MSLLNSYNEGMGPAGRPAATAACFERSSGGDEYSKHQYRLTAFEKTTKCFAPQDQDDANRQVCSGMYSRASWGGSMDPFILTKFIKPNNADQGDPIVSFVMFEWSDKNLIGVPVQNGDGTESVSTCLFEMA